jgi:putative phosphoesterase
MLVGVISDTHGLLRPEAIDALRGSAMIIHAGDIGKAAVLERLHGISPVIAVRGNIDTEPWAASLPQRAPSLRPALIESWCCTICLNSPSIPLRRA